MNLGTDMHTLVFINRLLFAFFFCFSFHSNRCSQESGGELGGFPATAAAAAFAAAGGSGGAPPSLGSSMQAAAAAYHLKTSAASSPYAAVNSIGLMDSLQTSMGCYPTAAGQNYHHHHSTTLSLFNHRKHNININS
ncbi:homeobox protein orthopedia-like [Aphis craccivora]|uniref:Homeobox protein orthopedia-like n=1 Tax=Aphis craccivora TaxID=307492 RepID=A0A6G0Z6Y2_APHCR|nr:homeobox protein orthopedia-like [Aphis craccivora]